MGTLRTELEVSDMDQPLHLKARRGSPGMGEAQELAIYIGPDGLHVCKPGHHPFYVHGNFTALIVNGPLPAAAPSLAPRIPIPPEFILQLVAVARQPDLAFRGKP
jgi:hypothetical protein